MKTAPHNRAVQAGESPPSDTRRPGIERYIADIRRRFPQYSDQQVLSQAKQEWTNDHVKKGGAA